ncbi:uncharacterized protein BJ171DRAFT_183254 [Polychytrium aggregatum]|uniref:uncharacterized protein n=1 Tax=Polychytrium aggregatum TaxID=110093 RepID=UPI0022FE9AC1|nr:uncharacterized protein BJ171DRAFT_183254 [Polychytrium aggregatum]KAI9202341.1 hypothetical protein BJ171DRAFT_183254 [Polychytrium aggregatum]
MNRQLLPRSDILPRRFPLRSSCICQFARTESMKGTLLLRFVSGCLCSGSSPPSCVPPGVPAAHRQSVPPLSHLHSPSLCTALPNPISFLPNPISFLPNPISLFFLFLVSFSEPILHAGASGGPGWTYLLRIFDGFPRAATFGMASLFPNEGSPSPAACALDPLVLASPPPSPYSWCSAHSSWLAIPPPGYRISFPLAIPSCLSSLLSFYSPYFCSYTRILNPEFPPFFWSPRLQPLLACWFFGQLLPLLLFTVAGWRNQVVFYIAKCKIYRI